MRLINWNIERRGPHTWQAASLLSEMKALAPDIICLTEAHEHSCEALGGHVISAVGYGAQRKSKTERLVLLWSSAPWTRLPVPAEIENAGGACFGQICIEGHPVHVLGLCIPYHMSRYKMPDGEKTRPWEDHVIFLDLLEPWLKSLPLDVPLIIAGDFNQRIPRVWSPYRVYDRLMAAFSSVQFATAGVLSPLDEATIDHVAYAGNIKPVGVTARSRFETDGRSRSDHFGVVVDFEIA